MTEILSYISRPLSTECIPTPIAYNPNTSLLNSLLIFYSDPNNIKQLYLLISGEDKIISPFVGMDRFKLCQKRGTCY